MSPLNQKVWVTRFAFAKPSEQNSAINPGLCKPIEQPGTQYRLHSPARSREMAASAEQGTFGIYRGQGRHDRLPETL